MRERIELEIQSGSPRQRSWGERDTQRERVRKIPASKERMRERERERYAEREREKNNGIKRENGREREKRDP